jgi:hypothetical protein
MAYPKFKNFILSKRLFLPIGLLCLAVPLIVNNFSPVIPHFLRGFFIGLGATLILGSFIIKKLQPGRMSK